jgi:hypothetical protein
VKAAAIVALLMLAPAAAQENVEIALQAARQQQRLWLSGIFELTPAESDRFWRACDRYEAAVAQLDGRSARMIADLLKGQPPASTADEHLDVESERLALLKSHLRELRKVLPPAKLVRYAQLRNRMDLQIRWDIARQIPLAPQ